MYRCLTGFQVLCFRFSLQVFLVGFIMCMCLWRILHKYLYCMYQWLMWIKKFPCILFTLYQCEYCDFWNCMCNRTCSIELINVLINVISSHICWVSVFGEKLVLTHLGRQFIVCGCGSHSWQEGRSRYNIIIYSPQHFNKSIFYIIVYLLQEEYTMKYTDVNTKKYV